MRAEPTPEQRRALFRVVRGEPSDAEVAALTVVLAAVASAVSDEVPGPRAVWNDPAATIRRELPVGSDRWRTTYRAR